MALKSPLRMARVGSVRKVGLVERRISFHSCPPKKNSRPLLIGPPRLQPKSL
jgi:hypothetical protein